MEMDKRSEAYWWIDYNSSNLARVIYHYITNENNTVKTLHKNWRESRRCIVKRHTPLQVDL